MSRIGKAPIEVPQGVKVDIKDGNKLEVKGPKGVLSREFLGSLKIHLKDSNVIVERLSEARNTRSLHGLTRTLISNMVQGVHSGFVKNLTILGMGYRVAKQGNNLQLQIGYSHPVIVEPPEGITFDVEGNNKIVVRGIDKQLVGQIAANIRKIRAPEPYKGKGIRYESEKVKTKLGKAGKK